MSPISITPLPDQFSPPDYNEWIEVLHVGDLYSRFHARYEEMPCNGVAVFLRRKNAEEEFNALTDILTVFGRNVTAESIPICGTCGKQYAFQDIQNAAACLSYSNGNKNSLVDDHYLSVWKEHLKQSTTRLLTEAHAATVRGSLAG